ncbi:MAG: hypothetical protein OCD02_05410 [Spirochaetaceae bacterium]
MKKTVKLITALVMFAFFTGCIIIPLDDIDDNILTITNSTGYTIEYLYIVPESDFEYLTNETWNNYYSYYSDRYDDALGATIFLNNDSVSIDLDNYTGTRFVIVAFDDDAYVNADVYKVNITTSMSATTLDIEDAIY